MDTKHPKNEEQSHSEGGFHDADYITPRVLMIGSERKLFDKESASHRRILEYAKQFSELHIIVLTTRAHNLGGERRQISSNTWLYPTASYNRLLYSIDAGRTGKKILEERGGAWVVTVQDPFESGIAGLHLAKRYNKKLHVQLHTDPWTSGFSSSHKILNMVRSLMANLVLPRADCIRVTREKTKRDIKSRFRRVGHIDVLPIFVDVNRFRNATPSKSLALQYEKWDYVLLTVSRLEKEKRVERALDALAYARREGYNAGLVILGTGSEEVALRNTADKLQITQYVDFVGYEDAVLYYKIADLTLVTSSYEGYCLAIVESLASGTAVLSGDVGVAKEAGAIVVNDKAYNKKLVELLENGIPKGKLKDYPYQDWADYLKKYKQNTLCGL